MWIAGDQGVRHSNEGTHQLSHTNPQAITQLASVVLEFCVVGGILTRCAWRRYGPQGALTCGSGRGVARVGGSVLHVLHVLHARASLQVLHVLHMCASCCMSACISMHALQEVGATPARARGVPRARVPCAYALLRPASEPHPPRPSSLKARAALESECPPQPLEPCQPPCFSVHSKRSRSPELLQLFFNYSTTIRISF